MPRRLSHSVALVDADRTDVGPGVNVHYDDRQPATLGRLFTTTPYDPKVQRVVTRLWADLKSAQ